MLELKHQLLSRQYIILINRCTNDYFTLKSVIIER